METKTVKGADFFVVTPGAQDDKFRHGSSHGQNARNRGMPLDTGLSRALGRGPTADIEIGHTPQTETTQKQQDPSSPASGRIAVRGSGPQTE